MHFSNIVGYNNQFYKLNFARSLEKSKAINQENKNKRLPQQVKGP